MKLEEGMFIRYEGLINKILEIDEDYIVFDMNWFDHWADEVSSMKYDRFINDYKPVASHNIIDLIEVGDIITFKNDKDVYRVNCIPNKESGCECFYLEFDYADKYGVEDIRVYKKEMKNDLESIMTKEQFESMSYKVGE